MLYNFLTLLTGYCVPSSSDQYWDEVFPAELPYTVASEPFREAHPEPSTAQINVKQADAEMIPVVPSSVKVDEMVGKSLQTVNYTFPQPDQPDSEVRRFFCGDLIRSVFLSNCLVPFTSISASTPDLCWAH